jgi:hexosaminidase
VPLFPGPYWHIGGDEYMPNAEYPLYPQLAAYAQRRYGPDANGKDALVAFLNAINSTVRSHGKTARVWADDLDGGNLVKAHPSMITEWWCDLAVLSDATAPGPNQLLAEGHRIMNCSWFPTYYNSGPQGQAFPRPDMRDAYEHWTCDQFAGAFFSPAVQGQAIHNPPERVAPSERRNLGAKVHIWSAGGGTEQEIAAGVYPFLRVLAQKTWDTPALTGSYADYQTIMTRVGRPGGPAPAGARAGSCTA